jgi:hypothetical protein
LSGGRSVSQNVHVTLWFGRSSHMSTHACRCSKRPKLARACRPAARHPATVRAGPEVEWLVSFVRLIPAGTEASSVAFLVCSVPVLVTLPMEPCMHEQSRCRTAGVYRTIMNNDALRKEEGSGTFALALPVVGYSTNTDLTVGVSGFRSSSRLDLVHES